ncbi:glycosyltransferase family 9 protein [Dyadobacter sp. CY323]|uniref:glycosyltransferase family 9 protein n=1 Tax=Dyadobacter sp. CY323 TaxID=2907302 RepID=UPI001F362BB4|nr:glycosyltransferase family 9 protein [Dyadobacter sp. CY323]MCE6989727.1 glycosyltransferase family 9 protein [Dyadobacter sp. CY323]
MKFPPESTRKIAVFRALQLGDMLCAIPAMRALRAAYPDAEITLLGLPWAESLCTRFADYFDRFIHFPGFPGLPEQEFDPAALVRFAKQIREEKFDLILQMQGNGNIVNDMLESFSESRVAGFHSEGNHRNPDVFLEYPTGISEILRHLKLMEHLGIPGEGTALEFPVFSSEMQNLEDQFYLVIEKPYVCVHPGSRGAWRQWPPSHFACLADQCAGMGYQVIVTGTQAEAGITSQVIELMDYPAVNLTGKTGLGEIAQLIKESDLLISNCTGVSHIAAATETPSIVISMDGEPERWGPLNTDLHKTIDWTQNADFEPVMAFLEPLLAVKAFK